MHFSKRTFQFSGCSRAPPFLNTWPGKLKETYLWRQRTEQGRPERISRKPSRWCLHCVVWRSKNCELITDAMRTKAPSFYTLTSRIFRGRTFIGQEEETFSRENYRKAGNPCKLLLSAAARQQIKNWKVAVHADWSAARALGAAAALFHPLPDCHLVFLLRGGGRQSAACKDPRECRKLIFTRVMFLPKCKV